MTENSSTNPLTDVDFTSLGLHPKILSGLKQAKFTHCTPIQALSLPPALEGKDVAGQAQTGTGKTAGFTLPLLQRLMEKQDQNGQHKHIIRALVLTPTRELAAQVGESVETYAKYLPLKSTVVFGGVKINRQIERIRRGVDILVATPGRLLDHVSQGTVDLSQVDILVLDEADRMLDMGFINDIRKVLKLLPKKKQTLLFSATFSNDIKKLANGLMNNPALIEVARHNTASETVKQVVHPVDRSRKRELLSWLIGSNNWHQVLVFTRTKHGANRLTDQLNKDGITAAAIHGNKSQGARTKALANFKENKTRVLVATDIAARGLDINQLPHVVNFELPNIAEDYVHRIGRTGRAGNTGEALSLVCIDEHDYLKGIEKLIKKSIPKVVFEGYEPDPSIKAEPIQNGRQQAKKPRTNNGRAPIAKRKHNSRKSYSARGTTNGASKPNRPRHSSAAS